MSRTDAPFTAELVPYVKERGEVALHGTIDREHNSLVAAINASGENVMLAIEMAGVFSGEIDFNNDLRQGDRFEVLFEKYYREDVFSGYGDVLAAEFVNDGRRVQAFRFHVPGEPEAQYFDENGRSMKRLFLRSPFRFEPRVTSRFSFRRVHPVLGGVRPHLGVDYGAPAGTPVIAVANGTVVSSGMSGGSGNMVRLRHTNGYETYYLHLSAFAKGIRRGARVSQGQMVGRVGSTGLSTAPHLDYRLRKNGTLVNPLLEHRKLPPGDPVPGEHLEAFHAARDEALTRLVSRRSPLVNHSTSPSDRHGYARPVTLLAVPSPRLYAVQEVPRWPSSVRSVRSVLRLMRRQPWRRCRTTSCRGTRRGAAPKAIPSAFFMSRAPKSVCRLMSIRTVTKCIAGRPRTSRR